MEPMSSMELKIMSCKGLTSFNFFQKLCVYVAVSVVFEDPSRNKKKIHYQQQKTPIDREGDGDPEWKHEVRFDLESIIKMLTPSCYDHLFLEFDLLCGGMILGDKSIGKVRVPFKDLIAEFNGGAARFVSYQVQTWDGKPNGVLNFSYKLIGNGIQEEENQTSIGSSVLENNNFTSVQPSESLGVVHNPYPAPAVYYPYPLPAAEVHHPSSSGGVVYMSAAVAAAPPYPPPAPAEMVYYPPMPQPMFYPPPPVPYGYGYGIGGYGNPQFGYPMVGQPHPPYGGPYGGAPHKEWPQRDGVSGSRGFSNLSQSQQPSSFLYSVG